MISRFSIAVLPFQEIGSGKEKYLGSTIPLEIINSLSRYSEIQVTSSYSSFRFNEPSLKLKEISLQLRVSYILYGTIYAEQEKTSINLELFSARDGFIVWSESWKKDIEEIFELEPELADKIALTINDKIASYSTTDPYYPQNNKALNHYLKAQYYLTQLDSTRWKDIIKSFELSISLDPKFSKPMIGLCHCYTWLSSIGQVDSVTARKRIDTLIEELLELSPEISDIYQLKADKEFWLEWKVLQSVHNLKRSLELKPNNSTALVMKGLVNASLGNIECAFQSLFQAERIDPFSENVKYCIGLLYHYAGDSQKARDYIQANLEVSPNWLAPYLTLVEIMCSTGDVDEIPPFIEKNKNVPGFESMVPVLMGLYAGKKANQEEARHRLKEISQILLNEEISNAPMQYYAGLINLMIGEKTEAYYWLEKGLNARSTPFLFIHIDHAWDELRSEEKFNTLVNISLPHPARTEPTVEAAKYKKASLQHETLEKIKKGLERLMEEEKIYLNSRLSLPDVAELCEVSNNQLSQYLNAYTGKCFSDYINHFRLAYFHESAGKDEFQHLSILGLAYESGFNSKTTFNTFFKRETGVTPKEYLAGQNK